MTGARASGDIGSGGVVEQPGAGEAFFGSSFVPESHGAGGSSGSSSIQSEFCGDFIRDPLTEECDAGPEDTVACSAQCQVQDFLLVEPPEPPASVPASGRRVLGLGRHPSAALPETLAVAFIGLTEPASVGVQLLDAWGNRGALVDAGTGAHPSSAANPVLAPLSGDKFALAFNDLHVDGSALGIALRRLDPTGPTLGPVIRANETTVSAQYDPDLLALDTGGIVVVWTDSSDALNGPDIVARQFDADLTPLGGEIVLGGSPLPEGNVALACLGETWAAAWRESQADGSDAIVVFSEGARWTIAVDQPGPALDRPALVALDDDHLLVAYTVGTDPLDTGVAATPRLHAAVVDIVGDTVDLLGPIEPLDPEYAGSAPEQLALGQHQPSVNAVGDHLYVGWRSDGLAGDARRSELFLKRLEWDGLSEELSLDETELRLPRWEEHGAGDQHDPALIATPLAPEGALLMAWTDYGGSLDAVQAQPDVAVQLAPVPLRRGPPAAPSPVIDNFEDEDGFIIPHAGREGFWYTYNDGTMGGMQSPAPGSPFVPQGPSHDSAFAGRVTGSGFTSWGAGVGFDLDNDGSTKLTYDATSYIGVTFWAKAASALTVRFSIPDVNTDPLGSQCTNCFDHFGTNVSLTTTWQQYNFTWDQLAQQGWGDPESGLAIAQLFGMTFQVGANQSFDIWFDDLAFVPAPVPDLIDDLEDGDRFILEENGRQGAWVTYNDGSMSGTQTPPAGASSFFPSAPGFDSSYAARTFGSGFSTWGAGLLVDLNRDGATKATYDASAYTGVSFWAKAASSLSVRFMIADVNTDADGGICTNCFDHRGANITVNTDWQQFTFEWGELAQQGWGQQFGALEVDQLYAVLFQMPPNVSFDLWVDDLALLTGGGP